MSIFFVTSSGTDIGKTHLCAELARELSNKNINYQILKPIISGFSMEEAEKSDSGILLQAMNKDITEENLDAMSPWRLSAPLSPHMAAALEGKTLSLDDITTFCRNQAQYDLTLIEAVGGVMVPLNTEHTVLDWITALGAPALVVVGSYLGSISHSLTTLEILHARNIPIAAIIVSESEGSDVDLAETVATLKQFNPTTATIVALPRAGSHDTITTLLSMMMDMT